MDEDQTLESCLLDLMGFWMRELETRHPFNDPGQWDAAVTNIKSARMALLAQESKRNLERLRRACPGPES